MSSAAIGPTEFAEWLAPLGPFGPAPALAAGVSGGPHSLALAWLAAGWARARGGSLLALIADHGLRPDSAAEAAAVAAQLIRHGIAARVLTLGLRGGSGVQARARAMRLDALAAAAAAAGRPWLLLGQHRDDQAETLLLRGLAGSGAAGLSAMAPVRPMAAALLLRPLLHVPPARLEATVAAAGLAAIRDPSNRDRRFARVRVRLAAASDDAGMRALASAATGFGRRRAPFATAVAVRLSTAAVLHPAGDASLDLAALGDDAVADAALAALLRAVGGGAYVPSIAAVARLRQRGHGTLGGARLRPAGLRHHLAREAAAVAPPIAAVRGALWDRRFLLTGPGDPRCTLGALGADRPVIAGRAIERGAVPDNPLWLYRMSALPAMVVSALPAIRRDGVLEAVPQLAYPGAESCRRFGIRFAPAAGPVVAAWDMAVAGNPPHVTLVAGMPAALERDPST